MKLLSLCLLGVVSILLAVPLRTGALQINDNPALIISEIKIKNDTTTNGYNEFIELYNGGITSLNLNKFTIEYFNTPAPADNDQPVKKVVVADGLLPPTQTIVLAANKQQISGSLDSPFLSLSDSSGLVRIRDLSGTVEDQFAWTSTSSLAISPVIFLSSSTSNKNKSFTRSTDSQGNLILVNPSWQLITPTPHADSLSPAPKSEPDPDPSPVPPAANDSSASEPAQSYASTTEPALPLQISELLPNPAPPASDSTDEFVELYNPTDEMVSLKDYSLQTGNSYSYKYTFPDTMLNPHEYRAFTVAETGLLLANSGGRSRLLDPGGRIIFETEPYTDAAEGAAWVFINGSWQWSTTPTPNSANLLTSPVVKSTAAKSTSKAKTTSAKTSTKKVAGAKTAAKPKVSKSTSSKKAGNADNNEQPAGVHAGIIAGVGIIALGYAIYEYRHDIGNRIYQLRRYRETRATSRAKP